MVDGSCEMNVIFADKFSKQDREKIVDLSPHPPFTLPNLDDLV